MSQNSISESRNKDFGISGTTSTGATGGSFHATMHPEPEALVAPENPYTKKYDTVKAKVEALRAELDNGVANLSSDAEWHEFMDTMSKFHRYSMNNQLLIHLQCPEATHVAGFNKWKKDFSRQVMKGQKAIAIIAPMTRTKTDPNGAPVLGPTGKPVKEMCGWTSTSVFDISQTEGKDLPSDLQSFSEEPPAGFAEDLTALIEAEGFTVNYEEIKGGAHGFTRPSDKTVVIDTSHSAGSQAKTLAHELGHIKAGHLDRTGEYHQGAGGCRGEMEVEAESIAYVLCRANGMSTEITRSSSTYLDSWSRKDTESITRTAKNVSTTVKALLETGKFRNVDA